MSEVLLEVKHLKKYFPIRSTLLKREIGAVKAVDDVSFFLNAGETIGIVGESGCGKSTLGRVLMKVYQPTAGQIIFDGKDITDLKGAELRENRKKMQMIFQDPYASLNPKMRVRDIVAEPLWVNGLMSKTEAYEKVDELLTTVGLRPTDAPKFPHQFSGGQRQRVGIARAIAMNPKLIIADEAVSALDVSVQAQILNLMMELKSRYNLAYIFISHNLAVVKHISDKVGVMYLGNMMEIAEKNALYGNAKHPYTQALLSAAPVADRTHKNQRIILTGDVPNPANPPKGCPFHTRCSHCMEICKTQKPVFKKVEAAHYVACHLYDGEVV